MGHGEQRSSLDVTTPKPVAARGESVHSLPDDHSDISVASPRYGWPHLAEKMAQIPEFAAFPRFGDLNTRNLLYYQVQLKLLRRKILREEENVSADRYDFLVEDGNSEYHRLLMELRSLLRDYSMWLLSVLGLNI